MPGLTLSCHFATPSGLVMAAGDMPLPVLLGLHLNGCCRKRLVLRRRGFSQSPFHRTYHVEYRSWRP